MSSLQIVSERIQTLLHEEVRKSRVTKKTQQWLASVFVYLIEGNLTSAG
jgi:hypothetical protein